MNNFCSKCYSCGINKFFSCQKSSFECSFWQVKTLIFPCFGRRTISFWKFKEKSGLNFDWTHPGHFNNQDLDNVPIVLLIFVLCFESKLFWAWAARNLMDLTPVDWHLSFSKNWRRPQTKVVFRKIKKSVLLTFVNYLWHLKRRFISESFLEEKIRVNFKM